MIKGIILIIIGIIGMLTSSIIGIKFMKKNNILLKGNYEEFSIIDDNSEFIEEESSTDMNFQSEDTELLLEDENYDTELLD